MAEFSEVMKQFDRLCVSSSCPGCPLEGNCDMAYARDYPQVFEKRVMEWVKEHPEAVYPTWKEWLISVGVLERMSLAYGDCDSSFTSKVHATIPADIAEKLGIKPEEAKHD